MSSIEPTGYDQESAHFRGEDVKALAKLRAAADSQRAQRSAADAKATHWMRCPKCGGQLTEQRQGEVMIDKCTGCGGVFLDAGELELLAHHQHTDKSFLSKLLGN